MKKFVYTCPAIAETLFCEVGAILAASDYNGQQLEDPIDGESWNM